VMSPLLGDVMPADSSSLLTVCCALTAATERVCLGSVAAFGALGAAGRVMPDPQADQRLAVLRASGVTLVFGPPLGGNAAAPPGLTYIPIETLADLIDHVRAQAAHARIEAAALEAARTIARLEAAL